jgi:8-oxo-dGTP pyrophosphatase MutT (NUDIX family)
MNKQLLFQYCPKIVVLSEDGTSVLLAKRQGEADHDGTYSFIGGKAETTDESLVAAMQREKNEEIGEGVRLHLCHAYSYNVLFRKKDGNSMVLPHHLAYYIDGEITLSDEYSGYQWVKLTDLPIFEPKIPNILEMVAKLQQIIPALADTDWIML